MNNITVVLASKEKSLEVVDSINDQLFEQFDNGLLSIPELGVAKARKLLSHYGLQLPEDIELDPSGDEIAIELLNDQQLYLYVIYYLNEDSVYEFHCEIIDQIELDNILNEDEDEETD